MSPLCSRNARPEKALVGCRSEGLLPAILGATYRSKLGSIIFGHSPGPSLGQGTLQGEEAVLADSGRAGKAVARGWAGEKPSLFLSILRLC